MFDEDSAFLWPHPMVPGGDLGREMFEALRDALKDMKSRVKVLLFVRNRCYYCVETRKLLDHFVRASPAVDGRPLFEYDLVNVDHRPELARSFGITRVPSLLLLDGHIRYLGIPSGEEIRSLVETVIRISEGESGLEEETKRMVARISKPVRLEVIVTPLCPYCPYAVLLSHMVALQSYLHGRRTVISEAIEAFENPDIADRYGVTTVPVIAINGIPVFMGVPSEAELVGTILELDS